MVAIPESIEDQLDADWTGAGGAEPAYYIHKDWRSTPPLGEDAVWILSYTLRSDTVPVNDDFANENHTIDIIVNTATDEDRLKELADEVVRILNATALTGMTYQRLKNREIVTSQKTFNYQEKITYDLREQMKSSAAAYGAGTTGDFVVVGDLTVQGNDIKDSGGAAAITFSGTQNMELKGDVGIGVGPTNGIPLTIWGSDVVGASYNTGDPLTMERNDHNNINIISKNDKTGGVLFSDETRAIGGVIFNHADNTMAFRLGSTTRLTIGATGVLYPPGNKATNMGITGTNAFDNIYADDFVNESPFTQFENPASLVKAISAKEDQLDYTTLPDWVRATKRVGLRTSVIENKDITKTTVIVEDEGVKVVAEKGFSINRMCILLYQAVQELTERLEQLEERMK